MENSRTKPAANTDKVMREVDWQSCIDLIGSDGSRNQKQTLARAAARVGVKERLLRTLYHRETSEPKYSVGLAIVTAAKAQADRFEAIAASLENSPDADLLRKDIEHYRALSKRARNLGW